MAPSSKQINYIIRLVKGRDEHDAYAAIASDMGCSVSAARKRATSAEASRTIDRLSGGKTYPTRETTSRTAYGDYL